MATIRQLPPEIVAKIAAGEVIERPAFAVKELIENAIDANATSIRIYLEDAGLKKIQVTDNGEGMEKEDLLKSWHPHTTSKITEDDTLSGIKSFGFRGEALASLAAVSTLTIKSRPHTLPTGYEIFIKEGRLVSENPAGMPEGTIVTAENLFSHMPARRKFLKSNQTELRHCIEMVHSLATSYPSIHFVLQHNKRILLDLPATKDVTERIEQLVGSHTFSFFIPVKQLDSHIRITGFVAKPQMNASTPSKQFLFINKRKVTDRLISLAVKESFGTMLEPTSYPIFVLFLEIPYEMVDVNVHPRKEQVSLINPQSIFQTVKQTITEVLQNNNLTFQNLSWKRKGVGMTTSFAGKLLKEKLLQEDFLTPDEKTAVTQLHSLYILMPTKNGIVLVDQHAAHERILFEKLKKEFTAQSNKKNSYTVQNSIPLMFSSAEQLLFDEHKKDLEKIGFEFYKNTVTKIPNMLADRNPQEFIVSLLENVEQGKVFESFDKISEEMIAFLACRAAVKAGDKLTQQQMEKIVEKLQTTPNNATCPHGRPTHIFFEKDYIDSLFKR